MDPSQPRETFVTDVTTVLRYNDHSALCNDRSATFPNAQRWNAVPERSEHLLKAGTGILDWITGTACMERLFFSKENAVMGNVGAESNTIMIS